MSTVTLTEIWMNPQGVMIHKQERTVPLTVALLRRLDSISKIDEYLVLNLRTRSLWNTETGSQYKEVAFIKLPRKETKNEM